MIDIEITSEYIKLDAFLKWAEIVSMGTEAKMIIQDGEVYVNGEIETRRGKKLVKGDTVRVFDQVYRVI